MRLNIDWPVLTIDKILRSPYGFQDSILLLPDSWPEMFRSRLE